MVNPLIYVIVLNYNGREHLGYCLPSIAATDYGNYRILVIDNASSDGSAAMVAEVCPSAQLVRAKSNRGWSGGNNLGIQIAIEAGADYIILANNDIRVDPRWIRAAVEIAEADPKIGIIGFRAFVPEPGNPRQDTGFEHASVGFTTVELAYPQYVGGMAMFVRTELFARIGTIDEGFFAYGEENDFQIRTRKAGYSIVSINIPVWHYGQGSFGKIPIRAAVLQTRNNIRLLIKHGTPLELIHAGITHITRRILVPRTARPMTGVEQRLQATNPGINMLILIQALGWNMYMLPSTLKRRWQDNRRAAMAKQKWS
jgi:GT2 family glycosyltransferase